MKGNEWRKMGKEKGLQQCEIHSLLLSPQLARIADWGKGKWGGFKMREERRGVSMYQSALFLLILFPLFQSLVFAKLSIAGRLVSSYRLSIRIVMHTVQEMTNKNKTKIKQRTNQKKECRQEWMYQGRKNEREEKSKKKRKRKR